MILKQKSKWIFTGFFILALIITSLVLDSKDGRETIELASKQPSVTFEQVVTALKKYQAKNVADAIAIMNREFPELFSIYRVMFNSESFQQGVRILVHGGDRKFIFSFTPLSTQRGGGAIETMQYIESEARFLFREIQFPNESNKDDLLEPEDIADKSKYFNVSRANTDKCLACHGQDPRPNWESYNLWPKSLGAAGGFIAAVEQLYFKQLPGKSNRQNEFLKLFSEIKKTNSRLKPLVEFGKWPNLEERQLDNNGRFTVSLNMMNMGRLSRIISTSEKLQPLKAPLLRLFSCYSSFKSPEEFLNKAVPEEVRHHVRTTMGEFPKFIHDFWKENFEYQVDKLEELVDYLGKDNVELASRENTYTLADYGADAEKYYHESLTGFKKSTGLSENDFIGAKFSVFMNAEFDNYEIAAILHYLVEGYDEPVFDWPLNFQRQRVYHSGYSGIQALVGPLLKRWVSDSDNRGWKKLRDLRFNHLGILEEDKKAAKEICKSVL